MEVSQDGGGLGPCRKGGYKGIVGGAHYSKDPLGTGNSTFGPKDYYMPAPPRPKLLQLLDDVGF